MKNNHFCQAGQEAAQTTAATESSASRFNRMRSKLAFDRLVEMGAKMGMENPLFLCHERAAKATRPHEFTRPEGLMTRELCRVTYRKPVKGCPKYTEYFKARDVEPTETCTLHKGSFTEDAQRAIKGFFRSLWDKITG